MPELSQKQLEEMVEGKPQTPRAVFYDKARMNVEKSKVAGHRIYDTMTYLKETQAGVTDWVAVKARKAHTEHYAEEYQYYLKNKRGVRSPSIDIVPNITPAEIQELIDYGLSTIKLLSEAEQVPPHLAHIHRNAKILQSVFKEQSNGHEGNEENHIEEVLPRQEESPASLLHEANRRFDSRDVQRPEIPASATIPARETPERIQTGGRDNDHKGIVDPNWSMNGFTVQDAVSLALSRTGR